MIAFAELPFARVMILLGVFASSVWLAHAMIGLGRRNLHVRRQVRELAAASGGSAGDGIANGTVSLGQGPRSAWWRIVDLVEQSGLSLSDSKPDALRRKLVAAGFESPEAPRLYTFVRLLLIFLLPAIGIAWTIASGAELTILRLYLTGSILGIAGLILPAWIVRIRADRRREAITNGFPNCLDLLLVCVEAGLGIEAALDRVGRELAEAEPLVSTLLVRTTLHLRAGASREEALHRLGDTAGVDEVRSFCTLLIQSDKLGTSIATTLRIFAAEMRERRRMRAEEKAHRLPVLISLPLVACMLPTMVGVLMLPAMIRVIRQLVPAMGG